MMRIESLTFIRFVAAVIVVVFHFAPKTIFGGVMVAGADMVVFFFVLSGFVMAVAYSDREHFNARTYWWARMARIVPVYLLAIVLMLALMLYKGKAIDFTSVFLNVTLLQAWVPKYSLSLNGPGWSLSVEAFFYLTFPLILWLIKKYKLSVKQIGFFAVSSWVVTQMVLYSTLSSDFYKGPLTFSHDLLFHFPLPHLSSFLLGVWGGIWLVKHKDEKKTISHPLILHSSMALLVLWCLNSRALIAESLGMADVFHPGLMAPLFLFFILSISKYQSRATKILSAKPFVVLGQASYSIYILQFPVYKAYSYSFAGVLNLSQLGHFITALVMLIIASVLCMLIYEKPVNKWIRFSLPNLVSQWRQARQEANAA